MQPLCRSVLYAEVHCGGAAFWDHRKYVGKGERMDLYSRDYNINEIGEEDQRLKDCRREGLLIQTMAFAATLLGIILAYALSPTQEEIAAGAKVASLFGYPVWALVPAAVFFVQALIMVVLAAKVLKRPPLDARYQEENGSVK